jgi:hypothetical protein
MSQEAAMSEQTDDPKRVSVEELRREAHGAAEHWTRHHRTSTHGGISECEACADADLLTGTIDALADRLVEAERERDEARADARVAYVNRDSFAKRAEKAEAECARLRTTISGETQQLCDEIKTLEAVIAKHHDAKTRGGWYCTDCAKALCDGTDPLEPSRD